MRDQSLKSSLPPVPVLKKVSGPFKWTKIWNELKQAFYEGMPRRRHRRQLKVFNDCFTAKCAVDFLYEILKKNENFEVEVTRQQAVLLLRKFLITHVILDVNGDLGKENLKDDNHLYRKPPHVDYAFYRKLTFRFNPDDAFSLQHDVKPDYDEISGNLTEKTPLFSRWGVQSVKLRRKKILSVCEMTDPTSSKVKETNAFTKTQRANLMSDLEVCLSWKQVLEKELKRLLGIESLDFLISSKEINGEYICCNATKVGPSGVVQVAPSQDIPPWIHHAMACLTTWPREKQSGLPQYDGFQIDVVTSISSYYCKGEDELSGNIDSIIGSKQSWADEPLLELKICQVLAKSAYLSQTMNKRNAVEALRLSLLLLPPPTRRKLHLLLRLLAKVLENPDLALLHDKLSTRDFLLNTFSKLIYFDRNDFTTDPHLSRDIVTFLINNHDQVMEVPDYLEKEVKKSIMKSTPLRRNGDHNSVYNDDACEVLSPMLCRSTSIDALIDAFPKPKINFPTRKLCRKLLKSKEHRRKSTLDAQFAFDQDDVHRKRSATVVSIDDQKVTFSNPRVKSDVFSYRNYQKNSRVVSDDKLPLCEEDISYPNNYQGNFDCTIAEDKQ